MFERIFLVLFFGLFLTSSSVAQQVPSLYSEAGFRSLTADKKAHRIGDLLTVLVIESSSASATADTTANRSASISLDARDPNKGRSFGLTQANDLMAQGEPSVRASYWPS